MVEQLAYGQFYDTPTSVKNSVPVGGTPTKEKKDLIVE